MSHSRVATIVWLSVLHYFTHFSGFLSYLFIVLKKNKLSGIELVTLFGLLFLFLAHFVVRDPIHVVMDIRLYWGWLVFYFIFKSCVIDQRFLKTVFLVLIAMTLVEVILINTVIEPYKLPNFPPEGTSMAEYASWTIYQRPYGFGASPSVGSVLLVVMMALLSVQGWLFWLSSFTVLAFISGTGSLTLLVLIVARYKLKVFLGLFIVVPIIGLAYLLFDEFVSYLIEIISYKAGPNYFMRMVDWKLNQMHEFTEGIKFHEIIFGDPNVFVTFRGGDFGLFAFVLSNGILGAILFLLMVFSHVNKANRLPLFLIVLGSGHYSAVFFVPGQMLLGLLLSIGKEGLSGSNKTIHI